MAGAVAVTPDLITKLSFLTFILGETILNGEYSNPLSDFLRVSSNFSKASLANWSPNTVEPFSSKLTKYLRLID